MAVRFVFLAIILHLTITGSDIYSVIGRNTKSSHHSETPEPAPEYPIIACQTIVKINPSSLGLYLKGNSTPKTTWTLLKELSLLNPKIQVSHRLDSFLTPVAEVIAV